MQHAKPRKLLRMHGSALLITMAGISTRTLLKRTESAMLKYDVYVRGKLFACVEASCPVGALNAAHAKIGGDVSNGRLVVVRSDERGYPVTHAVEFSKQEGV